MKYTIITVAFLFLMLWNPWVLVLLPFVAGFIYFRNKKRERDFDEKFGD